MKNTSLSLPYFNSIKVRLESASAARLTMFLYFNFIKVRLEQIDPKLSKRVFDNFNSIKVRLEHK